jgi:hypothetical protein
LNRLEPGVTSSSLDLPRRVMRDIHRSITIGTG